MKKTKSPSASPEASTSMNRRSFLALSGAVGASVMVPGWSWAGSQSVAGIGGVTVPPSYVYDDEADPVVARLIDEGKVQEVNQILSSWKKNSQPLPAGLPDYLHDFIEEARQLPSWADMDKLNAADKFNQDRGTYLGVAYGFVSGMMSTVIPHEARAVYYSKGGADMKRRISRTAKFGYDIGSMGGFHNPNAEMVVTAVKTRLAHAGVRHLLPQSPHWQGTADQPKPISQRDILVTWHSLPTSVMRALDQWGVRVSDSQANAFLHSWQVAAHMLGVRDEYIPADWDGAYAQAPQILDPVLAPTPEGIKLAHILLDLAAEVDGGVLTRPMMESFTRYFLGDQIAEWLEIPRHPIQDQGLAYSWPYFVTMKEYGLYMPGSSQFYWACDEMLRQGAMWYLAEGQEINIEIPDMNNPNYS
ncbi:MAG: oxygenase MpaB family protein [Pseudomonadota bacterium]|nr:oxygenase MpaB family protein [Pseudomonadota bacterium]MEE3319222.1 oxygenase MpaB family protein [Pseudomonadota bacterium]